MNKLPFLLLLVSISLIYSCSENEVPDFKNDWDEDVFYFGKTLKEKHKNLFFNVSETEFENDISILRENTSNFTEEKTLIELSKIISKIGDSHTQFVFANRLTVLPIQIKWLDDGLFLTQADIENEAFLGKRIVEINETPISDVIENFRKLIAYENESNFKNQVVNYLQFTEFYTELSISESAAEISIKFADESEYSPYPSSDNISSLSISPIPLFLEDINTFYWFEELKEENILYIQYNSCRERSDLSFQSFTDQIQNLINNNDNLKKIVLDLRHNRGGNSTIICPLINLLEDYVSKNRFSKDKIYLILGRKTFSSAILNTLELKDKIGLSILGEPSGGKPNHYGEVKNFRLPNSLLNVTYSTKYFELSSNNEDSIIPDKAIEYNSNHFLNGIDPVLEKIKDD